MPYFRVEATAPNGKAKILYVLAASKQAAERVIDFRAFAVEKSVEIREDEVPPEQKVLTLANPGGLTPDDLAARADRTFFERHPFWTMVLAVIVGNVISGIIGACIAGLLMAGSGR